MGRFAPPSMSYPPPSRYDGEVLTGYCIIALAMVFVLIVAMA